MRHKRRDECEDSQEEESGLENDRRWEEVAQSARKQQERRKCERVGRDDLILKSVQFRGVKGCERTQTNCEGPRARSEPIWMTATETPPTLHTVPHTVSSLTGQKRQLGHAPSTNPLMLKISRRKLLRAWLSCASGCSDSGASFGTSVGACEGASSSFHRSVLTVDRLIFAKSRVVDEGEERWMRGRGLEAPAMPRRRMGRAALTRSDGLLRPPPRSSQLKRKRCEGACEYYLVARCHGQARPVPAK